MRNFIIELIVFLVILYFLVRKWPIPQIREGMSKTQDRIRASLDAADQARTAALAADEERHAALEETRRTAQEILAQADRTAEAEVALARQRAVDEATNRLGEIVMDVVERVIAREVSAESHHDLISEAVSALNADATGSAAASSGARQ